MTLYTSDRVLRSLGYTVTFRAGSQLATALSYVVLVRGMAPHDFGVYNLLQAMIPVISTAASLGIEQTLRRFQPEYLNSGNVAAAAWLRRTAARVRLVANLTLIAIILVAWGWIAPLFKLTGYRTDFAVFGVLVLIHFQSRILQFSLASHMLHAYSVGAVAAMSFVRLAGYLTLTVLGQASLRHVIVADIIAYLCSFSCMYVGYRRHCRLPAGMAAKAPAVEERTRLKRYALYNNFNDAGSVFSFAQIDNFFVAAFISPAAVATYAFYTRLREMIGHLIPVRLFENIVQPMFFSVSKDDAADRVPKYFTFLVNTSLIVYLPIVSFACVFHADLVTAVFGGRYVDDSRLLPMILILAIPGVLSTPITLVAQLEERASLMLLSQSFALYLIAAMAVLIPILGVYGAALSAGSFHFLRNMFVWWRVRRHARWLGARTSVLCHLAVGAGAVGSGLLLKGAIGPKPVLNIMVGIAICAVGFLFLLRSPALSTSDRELLAGVLKGRNPGVLRWIGLPK
jgi:O-antigen/teichoic acid export membrane protein